MVTTSFSSRSRPSVSVQLRPTVKPMGKALEYDVSLMERLYTSSAHPGTVKTMLNVSEGSLSGYGRHDMTARYNTDSRAS